jgi:hypothetical protein
VRQEIITVREAIFIYHQRGFPQLPYQVIKGGLGSQRVPFGIGMGGDEKAFIFSYALYG